MKFDREQVCALLEPGDAVEITVGGAVGDVRFTGKDTVRVTGRKNGNKKAVIPECYEARNTDRVYFYHLNHLGTPQAMTDEAGNIVWQADYKPFGEVAVTTGDVRNNFRFPGQYFDEETGLHYNWHRYYDPKTGRYMTPDPIGLEGGINLYAYVTGNPVNRTDISGLMEETVSSPKGFPGSVIDIILTRVDQFVNPDRWGPNQRTENFMAVVDVVVIVLSSRVDKIGDACLPKTYEILSGVRRSKAAELLGKKTINAEIVDAGMKRIGISEIPIEALRSPKTAIDVSTQKGMDRFMNTLNMTKNGSTPPDILVTSGTKGTRIVDIILDVIGGE